jgi:hypothetical protein
LDSSSDSFENLLLLLLLLRSCDGELGLFLFFSVGFGFSVFSPRWSVVAGVFADADADADADATATAAGLSSLAET